MIWIVTTKTTILLLTETCAEVIWWEKQIYCSVRFYTWHAISQASYFIYIPYNYCACVVLFCFITSIITSQAFMHHTQYLYTGICNCASYHTACTMSVLFYMKDFEYTNCIYIKSINLIKIYIIFLMCTFVYKCNCYLILQV